MRTTPCRSSAFRFFALVGLIFLGIATLGVATSSSKSESASASGASPSAEVDLICHTDNSADCYPKLFQPSDEFQIVHDDQDLPAGLHVRINISTGQKEAKINVPDEEVDALVGLPVDSSVLVVEPEKAEEIRVPAGAPVYESVGKIKQPTQESAAFYDSLKFVKKGLNMEEALESLEEISHDIYYGLKISEDYGTVKSLFCLANTPNIFEEGAEETVLNQARLAALIIAGSVQNNAKALEEMEKHWDALKTIQCPGSSEVLGKATFRLVAPGDSGKSSNDPAVARARASAIRGLIKSPIIRRDFLGNGGMGLLLEALVSQNEPGWELVQRKVALLVQDQFLDENLGAVLGEWPRDDQAADHSCESRTDVSEECWDWEVNRLVKEHGSDKGHWSRELSSWLREARKAVKAQPRARDEL